MATVLNPRDVHTTVKYLCEGSENERYFSNGIEINTGKYEDVPVVIHDARPKRSEYTLDTAGFTLVNHSSQVEDLRDREQLNGQYAQEMLDLVKQVSGADKVILYTPPVLRQNKDSPGSNYQPKASDVHTDWAPGNAEWTARQKLPEIDCYSRFMFVNAWRPISPPPQDWPLALIDARTVGADEGVVYPMLVVPSIPKELPMRPLPEHTVEGANFVHKPTHGWRYFSDMTKDEAIVFKLYDSDCKKGSKSWRCPHTAFYNGREGTNPRESVEIRTIAYFK